MINKIMKARAGFFTLLICVMCLVGFGVTTADLDQNSTADYEAFYNADSLVSVAIVSDLSSDRLEISTMGISCMECHFETLEGIAVFDVGKVVKTDLQGYNYNNSKTNLATNTNSYIDVGKPKNTDLQNYNYTNLNDVPITDTKDNLGFNHRLYQREKDSRRQFIGLYSTHINKITRIPQIFHNS